MGNSEFVQFNLNRLMTAKGWSLKRFALESQVSYHTVFRAVSKGVVPRISNLGKMALALGVSVADLMKDPREAPTPGERALSKVGDTVEFLSKFADLRPGTRDLVLALTYDDPSFLEGVNEADWPQWLFGRRSILSR